LLKDSIDGLFKESVPRVTGRSIVSAIADSGMSAATRIEPGTAIRFIGLSGCVTMQFHTVPNAEVASLTPEYGPACGAVSNVEQPDTHNSASNDKKAAKRPTGAWLHGLSIEEWYHVPLEKGPSR
jgi:hypothetical protein